MSLNVNGLSCMAAVAALLTLAFGPLGAADRRTPQAGGRVLVLDDFTDGLDAWSLEAAAEGNVKIVEDAELQRPALEWSLGDVGVALRYRKMDEVKDFGRFNRVRLRVRAWDDEDRKGVGCAAKLRMNISGWPKHLAERTPQWGLYDRNPEPSAGCQSVAYDQALNPAHPAADLLLVKEGVALAPIVVFENAPPYTRQAAEELAAYIEKVSGARPEVIEGEPDPLPEHAIWVGVQPALHTLFPRVDLDFKHPEEILIAANEQHLVVAGRDRWDPEHMTVRDRRGREIVGIQQEYGTVNAVYTFLQDCLGVRWLWPGELGEDVVAQPTIAFEPFAYRYHPQFRSRNRIFMIYTLNKQMAGHEWARFQRLQLDSLDFNPGHPFSDWWDRFHETHPEYLALQPDGSRGGQPGRTAKICQSNPDVWEQWLGDVEESLRNDPKQTVFGANPNDGWTYGYCTCETCRSWDRPGAETVHYVRNGRERNYVAMTDRQLTFANTLARKLRDRYPDRKELLVSAMAYGVSRPPPVAAVPDDNVLVSGVWSFHNQPNEQQRDWFVQWSRIAPRLIWRPNLSSAAGWKAGLPNVAPRRVIEDFRFVADHNVIGVAMDWIFGAWASQGPHYYMLAQMAWNPYADGEAILADYYQRAYGPAAKTMTGYWERIARAAEQIGFAGKTERDVWNDAFFTNAYASLDQAAKEAAAGPDVYAKRIDFARAGLDYLRLMRGMEPLIDRLIETKGQDAEARNTAQAQWEAAWKEIEQIKQEHPVALSAAYVQPGNRYLRKYNPDHLYPEPPGEGLE